jgi:hypothetical protein
MLYLLFDSLAVLPVAVSNAVLFSKCFVWSLSLLHEEAARLPSLVV